MPLLDGKYVASDEIDPAKHKFIGTFRPPSQPDSKLINGSYSGIILCPCGRGLQSAQETAEHWQRGHFDTPQYISISTEQQLRFSTEVQRFLDTSGL